MTMCRICEIIFVVNTSQFSHRFFFRAVFSIGFEKYMCMESEVEADEDSMHQLETEHFVHHRNIFMFIIQSFYIGHWNQTIA